MTFYGIDTDDCVIINHHPKIKYDSILVPYPLDPCLNLESNGVHIHPKYITTAPAKGSLIYAPEEGLNSLVLKDTYVEADSSNYDVLVTNAKVGYQTFEVLITKQANIISIYSLTGLDFSRNYVNTLYKGTIAVISQIREFLRMCNISPDIKRICDYQHLIQFTESPEYDLTPEGCQSLFEMCDSPDVETAILGLTTVLSGNLIKYKETSRALINVCCRHVSYNKMPEELLEALSWLHSVGISSNHGFSIYHKDLEPFVKIYSDYLALSLSNFSTYRIPFIGLDGKFNVVNEPVLYDPL